MWKATGLIPSNVKKQKTTAAKNPYLSRGYHFIHRGS
jgi:hypothetical protein